VPNGVILYYTVYCNERMSETGSDTSGSTETSPEGSDTSTISSIVLGNETSIVVTELIPYTIYDCYVTANTSVGEGNASLVESAQTDESGQSDTFTDVHIIK